MRPAVWNWTPAAADLVGHASNVTGATWTIATTSAGDSLAHQVTVRNDSITDHSAKTVALVGTDADGKTLTETMALPAGSATVTSTKYFRTLVSATPSATIGADTMDIGWTQTSKSQTIPVDYASPYANVIAVDISGTINFSVEETFDNPQTTTTPAVSATWWVISGLSGKTADTASSNTVSATAFRLSVTSVTAGATVKINTNQATR